MNVPKCIKKKHRINILNVLSYQYKHKLNTLNKIKVLNKNTNSIYSKPHKINILNVLKVINKDTINKLIN